MKILIAEDDPCLQMTIKILMSCWGYEYDIVSNGLDAVERAKKNEGFYDLCLMDLDMPAMDGCKATEIIRRNTKYFPILAVTGNFDAEQKCLASGMDDFLEKPYCADALLKKIKELTVKYFVVHFNKNGLFLKKEMPMDKDHAKEIADLAENNLRKVKIFDTPGNAIIVHKNVTNKISYAFIVAKHERVEFVNRDPEKPTRCELYKDSNYLMPQTYLTEEEYENLIQEEDLELEKYAEPVLCGNREKS